MARLRHVTGRHVEPLTEHWTASAVPPERATLPDDLSGATFFPAEVPGTVASALRAAGRAFLGADLEERDHWYRTRFSHERVQGRERVALRFLGLATIADVFLNGEPLVESASMFLPHLVDVTERLRPTNELCIRFTALATALHARRPRPRYRTRLVDRQDLRWLRTTLLGHMPGWSPPAVPIGPWRPITLERSTAVWISAVHVRPRLDGDDGFVDIEVDLQALTPTVGSAEAFVGDHTASLELEKREGEPRSPSFRLVGTVRVPKAEKWWPHTHGAPSRYPLRIVLESDERLLLDLGEIGFRTVSVDQSDGGFQIAINGVPTFCRGACFSPLDAIRLSAPPSAYERALSDVCSAGMNMLRISGTMVPEDDVFYDLCDARGVLLWHDYPFANMDYPGQDAAFETLARKEAEALLDRLETSPSLVVLCGGSEVEQQAAMLGLPREAWNQPLFTETLATLSNSRRPDVVYVPSTPTGGALPFHANRGVSHYYGVGAYLRPLEDVRRSNVRFAAECLALSNLPRQSHIDRLLKDGQSPGHHPAWKARVPRDSGAGWDFEDVRDHYVKTVFGVDPIGLRSINMDRYLELGRVVTGELLFQVFGEWRRKGSSCAGGLVWLLRDLWAGAGFGIVDADGWPKAPYYYARRAMAPRAVFLSDEGLNGLYAHVVNDGPTPLKGELSVTLHRHGDRVVDAGSEPVLVPAHAAIQLSVEALLGGFRDTSYAYRFGPPAFDLVVARIRAADALVAEAFHFPLGLPGSVEREVGLDARLDETASGKAMLLLRSTRFAQSVSIEMGNYLPSDNFFHLAPCEERAIALELRGDPRPLTGTVKPLNALTATRVRPRGEGHSA